MGGPQRYRGTRKVPLPGLLQISKTLATGGRTRANLATGVKGSVPSDFFYTAGADAWVTRWLTGDFDLAGQRIFGTQTVSVTQQQFLANCGSCTSSPNPGTVTLPSLTTSTNSPYNLTSASMGIKLRPFGKVSAGIYWQRSRETGRRRAQIKACARRRGLRFLNETGGSLSHHRAPLWGLARSSDGMSAQRLARARISSITTVLASA